MLGKDRKGKGTAWKEERKLKVLPTVRFLDEQFTHWWLNTH